MKQVAGITAAVALMLGMPVFAEDYKIDKAHSHALYRTMHLGTSWSYGSIPDIAGSLSFDAGDVSKSAISVTVKPASVMSWVPGRDKHLAGPDFFNSKEFPEITFKSTSWKKVDDDTYEVTGNFTLLGVTKSITAQVEHVGSGIHPRSNKPIIGFQAEFTIDRTDFGMNYGIPEGADQAEREVHIIFAIEAVQA